jgi:hypothetical protein
MKIQALTYQLEQSEILPGDYGGPDSDDLRRSFHKMTVPSGGRVPFLPAGRPFSLNKTFLLDRISSGNG